MIERKTGEAMEFDGTASNMQPERELAYPPSSHMRLGRGLSNKFKSRHSSFFDVEPAMDDDIKPGGVDTSFTEPDISQLCESSNNNDVLEKNSTVFCKDATSTAQPQDTEMLDS